MKKNDNGWRKAQKLSEMSDGSEYKNYLYL